MILICQNIKSIQERERQRVRGEDLVITKFSLSLNLQKKLIHLSKNEMDFKLEAWKKALLT